MPTTNKRFLGIDPGTTIIGYGVIELSGNDLSCLTYGTISNPGKDSSADKGRTAEAIADLVARYKPDDAAVEKLFFFKNKKSVMAVSEMRGVIMLALHQSGLKTREFTPLQVKQRICGHGRAEKKQIQKMMRMLLKLPQDIQPDDAADALAIALCCATAPKEY
jgi:crossover junction endodeoxyribonuclease RuvC